MIIDAWNRYFVELLYSLVLPTHNIVPLTSLHDQPCHTTMKKHEGFEGMEVSLFLPQNFAIQTWFCNCPQYFSLLHIDVECIPSIHDQGNWFSQINFFVEHFPTSDQNSVEWLPIRTVSQKFSHLQWKRLFKELWSRPATNADF